MPILKSLICLKGHDNGRRFLLISLACYLLLAILSPVFKQAAILVALFIGISLPIIATSAMRRIHDAGFATPLVVIPTVIYLFSLFIIVYVDNSSRWLVLILAAISTLVIATISNAKIRRQHNYHLGYHGPVDMSAESEIPIQSERIEPTITGQKPLAGANTSPAAKLQSIEQEAVEQAINHHAAYSKHQSHKNSWEQQLGEWLNVNRKTSVIAISSLILLTIILLIAPAFDNNEDNIQKSIKPQKTELIKERLNKIEMPDQFWIMLDQNDALTIGWEGDFKAPEDLEDQGTFWSATTGKGDKDCVNLQFSLGNDIKTLRVTVKNQGDYYADFSPVDTRLIVKSIAEKDRFKLCGYEFALKGTGNLLRKNKKYAQYLKTN